MERTAATIAGLELNLDAILTSPLVRAHQTAAIVAATPYAKDKLLVDDRLGPGFDRDPLAAIVSDHPDCESLLLVGHEPGMSKTVSALIGGGRIIFIDMQYIAANYYGIGDFAGSNFKRSGITFSRRHPS